MKKFNKVNIEITNICNLQCSFCPPVMRTKGFMPTPLFKKIIDEVSPLTEQITLHLMGDPLVHPKLNELIQICEEKQTPIFLVTNGVLLREDKAEWLFNKVFRQINFSLHSFEDNFPDKDPTLYLDKIFNFVERALKERPELYINFRLWNLGDVRGESTQNQHFLKEIYKKFGTPENASPPTEIDVRLKKSHRIIGRLYLHFDTEFIWPSLELPVLGEKGTCYGLRSHFGVLVDGTVVPCCLDKEGKIPLGNVQDQDMISILKSPRALKILKGFQERKLVEDLCKRCQYIERFN